MSKPSLPPLALIAGPTASGKLALRLAEASGGVIINADAAQVYRDLTILTARPTPAEEARAEHRLFGHIDGADAHSVAAWAADARAAIADTHAAGRLPILVGGTGLYIRTLLDGIAPLPPIAPEIRAAVRALPVSDAYAALAEEDADAAARLPAADRTRIARALEVVRSTGVPLAVWQTRREGGIADEVRLAVRLLLPPRDTLYARCDARFEAMLAAGAAAEVTALQARRLDPALPVMRAIGVREIAAWQAGAIGRAAMIDAAQMATRRYAKRQYTWLRHQIPKEWAQEDNEDRLTTVTKLL